MAAALKRYRVIAYAVGVGLLLVVFVAMPLRLAGIPEVSAIISPIHGVLYMVYIAFTLDLARRCGWSIKRTVGLLLAGTIPLLSFIAERKVTKWVVLPSVATANTTPEPAELKAS